MAVLVKDGVTITIENENTAAGYMTNGWKLAPLVELAPAVEQKKAPRRKKSE